MRTATTKRTLMIATNAIRGGLILLIPIIQVLPVLGNQAWPRDPHHLPFQLRRAALRPRRGGQHARKPPAEFSANG